MGKQDDKLIPADPVAPDVLTAHFLQTPADPFQRFVAGLVPLPVIHRLQPVHVQGSRGADALPDGLTVVIQGLPVQDGRQSVPPDVVGAEEQIKEDAADHDGFMQPDTAARGVQQRGQKAQHGADNQDQGFRPVASLSVSPEGGEQDHIQVENRNNEGDISQRASVEVVVRVISEGDIRKKRRAADQQVDDGGKPPKGLPDARRFDRGKQKADGRRGPQEIAGDGKQNSPELQRRVLAGHHFQLVLHDQQKAADHGHPEIAEFLIPGGFLGTEPDGKQEYQKQRDKMSAEQIVHPYPPFLIETVCMSNLVSVFIIQIILKNGNMLFSGFRPPEPGFCIPDSS